MQDRIKEYINKRDGKKYYYFNVYTGVNPKTGKPQKTTRRGFKTKTAAKQALKEIENKVSNGEYYISADQKKNKHKFSEIFEEWYNLRKLVVTGSTLNSYRVAYNHFQPIHNYYLKEITVNDITNILSQFTHLSQTTMDSLWNFINQIFDYSLNSEYIQKNILKNMTKPKIQKIKEEFNNFYTEEELTTLLLTLKDYDFLLYVMCRLMGLAGLRAGEVGALMWEDIDFKNHTIYINKTLAINETGKSIVKPPKTETSRRKLKIDNQTIIELQELKKLTGHQAFVFCSKRKDATLIKSSAIGNRLRRFFKKFPDLRPITPHGLRHTHASLLFRKGVPPKIVQQRLGHATVEMTLNVYIHVMPEDDNKFINKFIDDINI